MMLRAKFGVLRQILLDLGLTMHVTPKSVRFDDAEGRTLLLMPPYADDEEVYAGELVAARHHLDMRNLLSRERFEELLRQKLVAG
jgi:hypothetical protein